MKLDMRFNLNMGPKDEGKPSAWILGAVGLFVVAVVTVIGGLIVKIAEVIPS